MDKLDGRNVPGKAVIDYFYNKLDGPGAKAKAKAEATELWEEENGRLGNIEPDYFLWNDCHTWAKPQPKKPGSIRLWGGCTA